MADHVRTQIRDAAIAKLSGLATTGSRVFGGRPETRPLQESDLPGLLVYTAEEESAAESGTIGTRRLMRTCQLVVHGFAQGTGDVDKTLDTIAKEVEAALAADPTLGGRAKDLVIASTTKESADDAAQPAWTVRLSFVCEYSTREDIPDAALA